MTGHDDADVLNRWARKIARALEHAEMTEGAEAETFRRRAYELMGQYRIDAAHIDAARQPEERTKIVSVRLRIGRGPYQSPRQDLLGSLCRLHSCRMLYTTGWEGREYELIGHQSDIDVVQTLWTSLLTQAASAVAAEKIPGNVNTQKWKRSFFSGFANEATSRLREAQRVASERADLQINADQDRSSAGVAAPGASADGSTADGPAVMSTALVLKARSRTVDDFVATKYPKLASGRSATPVSRSNAYTAGLAAGRTADIGHGRIGGSKKAIAS